MLRDTTKHFAIKRHTNPITDLDRPRGFQKVEAPRFQDNRHMKVTRLSALRPRRLYCPGNAPGTHLCQRLSLPQGHSVVGRTMLMKNSSDTIGIRTRDHLACSAVPQPAAPPGASCFTIKIVKYFYMVDGSWMVIVGFLY